VTLHCNITQMYQFTLESVLQDDVFEQDTNKFNSNNHWINDMPPQDYRQQIALGYTHNWIDIFKPTYKKIIIDNPSHMSALKQMCEVGCSTGRFSKLYEDEMCQIVQDIEQMHGDMFDGTEYFVRTENVSLKYGEHRKGPYTNVRQILESLTTCIRGHTPIYPNTQFVALYLIPWFPMEKRDEFRVFVYKNKITAISQQYLHDKLYNENDENDMNELRSNISTIISYFYDKICPNITWTDSYALDIACVKGIPYFIEINSFGKEYASGSALFHWIIDEKIMYNMFDNDDEAMNVVHCRFTV
jgi:hypothetical protein